MAEFLTYKEKPLVRCKNEIYYGNMSDPYVIRFEILSSNNDIASKVSVKLLKSDIQLDMKDRVVKETTKNSMFEALDFGFVWLERALAE